MTIKTNCMAKVHRSALPYGRRWQSFQENIPSTSKVSWYTDES